MKDLLLDRRTHVLVWATVVVLIWPLFVVPGGAPWPGIIWSAALVGPFVVAATAFGGRTLQHSITEVIPRFKASPRAICDATRLRHCRAGNAQAVTTECAEQRKEG